MKNKYYREMTNDEYHADKNAISSTDVKTVINQTLFHWKNSVRKVSTAFDLGTALHSVLLEPEKDLVVKGPKDRRGNAWKDLYAEAEAEGKVLLTEGDYYEVEAMQRAVLFTPPAADLVCDENMVPEASFFVQCPETGLTLKCRPDGLLQERGIVFDIKTTQDASPNGFARAVSQYAYDVQSAFYTYVLSLCGITVDRFLFVAVEKSAPYCVQVHELSNFYSAQAHVRMMQGLRQIAKAIETEDFGTHWPDVNVIELPKWLAGDQ